ARSTFPHNEMANARRLGTAASMTSRMFLCGLIFRAFAVLFIEAMQDFGKTFRHALLDDFVVHLAELLADLRLDVSSEFRHRLHVRSLQLHELSLPRRLASIHRSSSRYLRHCA